MTSKKRKTIDKIIMEIDPNLRRCRECFELKDKTNFPELGHPKRSIVSTKCISCWEKEWEQKHYKKKELMK